MTRRAATTSSPATSSSRSRRRRATRTSAPAQLFGRDRLPGDADTGTADGLDVIEFVPDYEVDMLVPPPRQRAGFQPTVPPSLKQALADYVLASAAWLERSGQNMPCTMLIHTDMRRAMQNPLATEVTDELA